MMHPPITLNTVPSNVTPPFVPRGTFLPEVIRIGVPSDNIPSSEAKVSARLVEWWAIKAQARADANGSVLKSEVPKEVQVTLNDFLNDDMYQTQTSVLPMDFSCPQ